SPNGPGRYRPVAPRRVVLASRAGGPCSRSTCSARSACPLRSASDRSARRRTHACAGLCTPRSTLWAVELRREKSRRRPQDRVRPAQLTHFLLQFDQALGLASRGSGTVSLVDLRLHDPIPQSLGIDPELLAHTTERARPHRWIPSRLNSHPRGSLPKLVRVLPRCCHAPHPPVDSEPPPGPGRFMVLSPTAREKWDRMEPSVATARRRGREEVESSGRGAGGVLCRRVGVYVKRRGRSGNGERTGGRAAEQPVGLALGAAAAVVRPVRGDPDRSGRRRCGRAYGTW